MALRESTRLILESDKPSEWLALADMYIGSFNQMPDAFVLPADHAALKPIIESFHSDPESFIKYIRAIRDQLPPGDARSDLHTLYRTILNRQFQQSRRARLAMALLAVECAIRRPLTLEERTSVSNKLEQGWGLRRREFLKQHRAMTDKGRLSTDMQNQLLAEFWAEIDAEITRGELPIFKL